MERWQKPLTVINVEPGDDYQLDSDGSISRSTKITYSRESTERIRLGYACARCLEVFEIAWPVACTTCGAPIRERQLEYFEREYGGVINLSPTSWDDEIAAIEEHGRKEEERNGRRMDV